METRMDVGTAKLAVVEARKSYEAAVAAYRTAVNPTKEEFENTELSMLELREDKRHHSDHDPVPEPSTEEVLDEVVNRRKEEDDEEDGAAKSAGV